MDPTANVTVNRSVHKLLLVAPPPLLHMDAHSGASMTRPVFKTQSAYSSKGVWQSGQHDIQDWIWKQ